MKNKSFKNPVTRVGDKFFDFDNDGELNFLETMARDSQIEFDEKLRKKTDDKLKQKPSKSYLYDYDNKIHNRNQTNNETEGQSRALLYLTIIILIAVMAFVFFSDIHKLIKLLTIIVTIFISILLLYKGNWIK